VIGSFGGDVDGEVESKLLISKTSTSLAN